MHQGASRVAVPNRRCTTLNACSNIRQFYESQRNVTYPDHAGIVAPNNSEVDVNEISVTAKVHPHGLHNSLDAKTFVGLQMVRTKRNTGRVK